MDENIKKTKVQSMTLTIRRAEANEVVISSFIYALIACCLLNGLFYIINKADYLKGINSLSLFNVLSVTVLFFVATIVYSYCLFIESTIQYRKRKFYYNTDDKTYSIVFSLTVSIVFALIIALFLVIVFNKYMHFQSGGTRIKPIVTYFLRIGSYLIIAFLVNFYFYKIVKVFLYRFLTIKDKFFSSARENVDTQIHSAKVNHWDLWLISLKILNIDNIAKILNISKKKIIKEIIYNFTHNVKSSDIIISLNNNKGIIGYLVKNLDAGIVDSFVTSKIVPLLEKEMIVKSTHLDLKVEYTKDNLGKNAEIDSIGDVISDLK